jgi:carbamoyl-phosphate synthase large subunit
MNVVYEESALEYNLSAAASVSPLHPVVITKFIDNAQEIDVDAVAHNGKLLVHAVSEHVENAGVHSGDATLVLPPFSLSAEDMSRLKVIAQNVAAAFEISGPFNMQIIRKPGQSAEETAQLRVIECNLRASRSFPFVSKVLGHNFIDTATAAIVGENVPQPIDIMAQKRDYISIKVAQFSWTRLGGADPFLGVGKFEHVQLLKPLMIPVMQKCRVQERWPASERTFTKPTGRLCRAQLVSKYHVLGQVFSLEAIPRNRR